jgi:hypothetical protein
MKTDKKFGMGFLIIGLAFVGINYYLITNSDYYYPKMLICGFSVFLFGISMMVFPGGEIPDGTPASKKIEAMFKNAPLLSKIMWIALPIAGIIGGFWWCFDQGLMEF